MDQYGEHKNDVEGFAWTLADAVLMTCFALVLEFRFPNRSEFVFRLLTF